jgi:hypothetical protein
MVQLIAQFPQNIELIEPIITFYTASRNDSSVR